MVENIDKIRAFFHKENAHIIDNNGHDMGLDIDEDGKTISMPSDAEVARRQLKQLVSELDNIQRGFSPRN